MHETNIIKVFKLQTKDKDIILRFVRLLTMAKFFDKLVYFWLSYAFYDVEKKEFFRQFEGSWLLAGRDFNS